jgi:3-carboxy-cis,cis-muconate cycloisomerase
VGAAAAVLRGGVHEHERAAGAWHAEWSALSEALALTGGAAAAVHEVLEGLEVDMQRMRENLEASRGLVLAERVSFLLTPSLGRAGAQEVVAAAADRAVASGSSLRDELAADDRVTLSLAELDAAFDPSGYLGSAEELVEAVLALYRSRSAEQEGVR